MVKHFWNYLRRLVFCFVFGVNGNDTRNFLVKYINNCIYPFIEGKMEWPLRKDICDRNHPISNRKLIYPILLSSYKGPRQLSLPFSTIGYGFTFTQHFAICPPLNRLWKFTLHLSRCFPHHKVCDWKFYELKIRSFVKKGKAE